MGLGSDIVTALNALSEADKRDMTKVWDAIGGEIEDYPSSPQSLIFDNRAAGDVTPDDLPDKTIYFTFTDDIAGSPNTWDAVLNVKGWGVGYSVWQLFSSSSNVDTNKNLYFRRGRNAAWDTLQKIWTDQNDGIDSGLNADLLDGYHEGSFFRLSQNEIVTGRPSFNGGASGVNSPFIVDSSFLVSLLNADRVDGIHGASFIRSDVDYNVSAHTEWQDNYQVRLGTDADYGLAFNGSAMYFLGYKHGAPVYFQGENASGVNKAMLYMDPDSYVNLYYAGAIKLETVSGGAKITGALELTAAGSKFYSPVGGEDSWGTFHRHLELVLDNADPTGATTYTITCNNLPEGTKGVWVLFSHNTTSQGVAATVKLREYGTTNLWANTPCNVSTGGTYTTFAVGYVPLDSSKRFNVFAGHAGVINLYVWLRGYVI